MKFASGSAATTTFDPPIGSGLVPAFSLGAGAARPGGGSRGWGRPEELAGGHRAMSAEQSPGGGMQREKHVSERASRAAHDYAETCGAAMVARGVGWVMVVKEPLTGSDALLKK